MQAHLENPKSAITIYIQIHMFMLHNAAFPNLQKLNKKSNNIPTKKFIQNDQTWATATYKKNGSTFVSVFKFTVNSRRKTNK